MELDPSLDFRFEDEELTDEVRAVMKALRQLMVKTAPELAEKKKWSSPAYVHPGSKKGMGPNVCYIAGYTEHVNLGFYHGALLGDQDPQGLLEGTGKGLRHVKLRSMAELEEKREALEALVRVAVEREY